MSFPTTRWTLLAEATLHGDAAGREALARMCEKYRRPVIAHLESRGLGKDEAEDAAQEFFLKLIESRAWKRADQAKGKFRTFMISILNHTMMQAARDQHRQKRGGGMMPDSIDELMENGHEFILQHGDGTAVFDREWALTLVADAMVTVEADFAQRGQQREFALLQRFLPGPEAVPSYESAAGELGMSHPALKAAVHRLRQRFREVLRTAVARTVSAPHEVDEELRYLGALLIGAQESPQHGEKNGKENRE